MGAVQGAEKVEGFADDVSQRAGVTAVWYLLLVRPGCLMHVVCPLGEVSHWSVFWQIQVGPGQGTVREKHAVLQYCTYCIMEGLSDPLSNIPSFSG
jgi:hypothetical protein